MSNAEDEFSFLVGVTLFVLLSIITGSVLLAFLITALLLWLG